LLKPISLLSAAIVFAACAASTIALAQDATNPAKPTSASQTQAKNLYARDCALCHGDNGNGKTDLAKDMQLTLLDWTDSKSLANQTDKDLFRAIRVGKDKMPPEDEGRAKDNEVWNLIIYIRGFSKGQPAAAPAPAAADPAKPGN
jgi:mono/diheme cytochrome c family protein